MTNRYRLKRTFVAWGITMRVTADELLGGDLFREARGDARAVILQWANLMLSKGEMPYRVRAALEELFLLELGRAEMRAGNGSL